jgi:hypothetical protein
VTAKDNLLVDSQLPFAEPFKYRWTDFGINTGVVEMHAGVNKVRIGDATACINLPKLGSGVRGILFGDPCTAKSQDPLHPCMDPTLARTWDVETKLTELLNKAALGPNPINFWAILGDNFYDSEAKDGATESFFQRLSPEVKSTFLMTVIGNHDYELMLNTKTECNDQFG